MTVLNFARQVPQVRDRDDLRGRADFREALADAVGLVQVELDAGASARPPSALTRLATGHGGPSATQTGG